MSSYYAERMKELTGKSPEEAREERKKAAETKKAKPPEKRVLTPPSSPPPKPVSVKAKTQEVSHAPPDIPRHVWKMLQEGGELAAERLLEMLNLANFHELKATEKARLIDMALTRAYGLPVRRSVNVELQSENADAVAAALADLHAALPESEKRPIDITPTHYRTGEYN